MYVVFVDFLRYEREDFGFELFDDGVFDFALAYLFEQLVPGYLLFAEVGGKEVLHEDSIGAAISVSVLVLHFVVEVERAVSVALVGLDDEVLAVEQQFWRGFFLVEVEHLF